MESEQLPSEGKRSTNTAEEESSEETMIAIRPTHVAPAFEDFSIFDSNNGDAFEPLPMDRPRTEQQTAAISRVFQDSIRLFQQHSSCNIRTLQDPEFQTHATQSSNPFASTPAANERFEIPSPLERELTADAIGLGHTLRGKNSSEDAIGLELATNQAIQPSHQLEDQRISQPNNLNDEYLLARFRPYQAEQWEERFSDLLKYRKQHGHCCVPLSYPENPSLARWVKRQRHQYKLRSQGEDSTMTSRRIQALEKVGFIWDSHNATWEERMNELKVFRRIHGHCEVPTHYKQNKRLGSWVKAQRRQYKLYRDGKQSTLTPYRIDELDQLNFSWEMRAAARPSDD